MAHPTDSKTNVDAITKLISNIANHVDVNDSAWQMTQLIEDRKAEKEIYRQSLQIIIQSNPIQLVINDMAYVKTNQKQHDTAYFLRLQNCSLLLKSFVRNQWRFPSELHPTCQQFQLLFDVFVMDQSSDDQQRFIILDLLLFILRQFHWPDLLEQWHTQHFVPAMLDCRLNEDYSLLSKLYYVFSRFCMYLDDSENKLLSLDYNVLTKSILNALHNTQNKIKYNQMIRVLVDITKNEKEACVPLLTEEDTITDAFRRCLKDMFDSFATNVDGSMNVHDFRRYILACGAGYNSASPIRINAVFQQKDSFTFDAFCAFYGQAIENRPKHVWNDLYVFGYNNQMTKGDQVENGESVYQLLKHSHTFNDILSKYYQMTLGLDYAVDLDLCMLPVPEPMRNRMVQLDDMAEFLDCNVEDNEDDYTSQLSLYQLQYKLLRLESLCVLHDDYQWKQEFIRHKAWDHLIKLYF
eukprot:1051336_1